MKRKTKIKSYKSELEELSRSEGSEKEATKIFSLSNTKDLGEFVKNIIENHTYRLKHMKLATAFLSHSSQDKRIVEPIAKELCHLGIIPWLDTNCLPVGTSLEERLGAAVEQNIVLLLFITESALNSSWVNLELDKALQLEKKMGKELIIPIFFNQNPKDLIKSHSTLEEEWINSNGELDRIGIILSKHTNPEKVAIKIAERVFELIGFRSASKVNIVIDQRGNGKRECIQKLPTEHIQKPTLVFRPDQKERTRTAFLKDGEWQKFTKSMLKGFGLSIGNLKAQKLEEVWIFWGLPVGLIHPNRKVF